MTLSYPCANSFPLSLGPIPIRLRVGSVAKAALETMPYQIQSEPSGDEKSWTVSFDAVVTQDLLHWIYAASSDVEVLAPLSLREVVRQGISSALNQYRLA